ncbi:MAG: MNIO family bufferin maturase [Thiotrichales bacterium]
MTFGFGLGLRTQHYQDFLEAPQPVDWLEVISDNYMVEGGKPLAILDRIRDRYPMAMHGVSLSIGSIDGLNDDYLCKLKALEQRIEPMWVSDHLCWTGVHGRKLHDLMPLPFTREAVNVVTSNVHHVQELLQRPLVLENVSSYVEFESSEMTEWEFLTEICNHTGCKLLLDINNVYVSAFNHGFSPDAVITGVPIDSVFQFHLAGHQNNGDHLIDTHDHPVCDEVWGLYQKALQHFGDIPTMIERDDHVPPLEELIAELDIARALAHEVLDTKMAV